MSADKKTDKKAAPVTLRGRLALKTFGLHSKSEHLGVYLVSDQGEFLIRPADGNPFTDNPLTPLAGKQISATGTIVDYVFLVNSWQEINDSI